MKVLLTGAFNYTDTQLSALKATGVELVFFKDEREKITFPVSDIDAVVCNGLFLHNNIEEFKKLKFIQATSAGLERMPLDYIKQNNITLKNARGVYSVPMAEYAVLGTLLIYKQTFNAFSNQQNHLWVKQRELSELSDKNILIVGAGSVGAECAKRFSAFSDNVYGVDMITEDKSYFKKIYPVSSLKEKVNEADVIVLTLPLSEETEGIFSKELIADMKKTAVIVNISRGKIVDEDALINSLKNKNIRGAVLDVFQNEPLKKESPLWDMPNVIVTPHNSFVSDKTSERLFTLIQKNLEMFMNGEGLK